MALISTKLHGALDYAGGLGSLAAPRLLRDKRAAAVMAATGAATLGNSALTDYELGIRRTIPMRVHLITDAATGALLLGAAALLRRRRGVSVLDWAPLAIVGLTEIAAAALTEREPSDRPADDSLPGAATAAGNGGVAERADADLPSGDVDYTPDDDIFVAQQASAAAAEAGRIGGRVPSDTGDPSMDPVYQGGGGEEEGFEETEAELIENATHGDGYGQPERDAISPELESDRSTAVYGEGDQIPSTELTDDPGTGAEDPGEGPGLPAERGPGVEPNRD